MVRLPDSAMPDETPQTGAQWYYPIADMVAGGVQTARPNSETYESSRWLKVVAGSVLLSSIAGLVWGSHMAAQELRVRLAHKVEASLNRPVEWGMVQAISPQGIRLGKTTLPPVGNHGASLEIEAIDIAFNWGALFRQQTPKATVTLVRPHLVWRQNSEGEWPSLSFDGANATQALPEADLQAIEALRIRDGSIAITSQQLHPQAILPRTPIVIERIDAEATVFSEEPGQQVTLRFDGEIGSGGFKGRGTANLAGQAWQANLQVYNLPMTGLNLLLPPMVGVESGTLNSNLAISAALANNGHIDIDTLDLRGTAIVQVGQTLLGQLPEPISNLRSSLWFQGDQVTLHNAGLQIGDLSLTTEGTVGLRQGYDLLAEIPTISAGDIQKVVGADLEVNPDQIFEWQTRVTGPLREPAVETLSRPHLVPPGQLLLEPELIGVSMGMGMLNLPMRDRIPLIEGATYEFRSDGAWFVLTDGTVVPPLSRGAYERGAAQLASTISPTLDRKFYWLLQSSPYITAIAADLGRGQLRDYVTGGVFDTNRFFVEYFMPVYRESSYAAGLDPGEALWMLDHSLRTLQDPLLRTPEATPITSGAGTVGSFWQDEQLLSMQQLMLRPQIAQEGYWGNLARFAILKHLSRSTSIASRRLSSTPEVVSKLPNVTFGAEEGAIAHALAIAQFQGPGIYADDVISLADRIVKNEFDKQLVRSALTAQMQQLATNHSPALGETLANFSAQDWHGLGLTASLSTASAAHLNGTNTLSILVSRSEKAGYSLEQAYGNSRALLLELLQDHHHLPEQQRLLFAVLKDQAFTNQFWALLAERLPQLVPEVTTVAQGVEQYRQLAEQGASLHEAFYAAMVQQNQDIGVSAAIKHAVGFQANLAELLDQAFSPADPADPNYLAFRRSLAIYLREAPDISVYGGTEAALRLYGYETLNVQEMLAVDVASAPRIRALARLYNAAWQGGMIRQWDIPGFQRILLVGALLAAGVEREALPANLADIGFPSPQFRRDLLFVVGPEGIKLEATRLGVQAHDHRVSFQPVALPDYRAPSFDVTNARACPTQPEIQAIALGPQSAFVWYPTIQQVVLKRGEQECPLYDDWNSLFFDTLLESVPVVHSPEGAAELQAKLRAAQLLEAGIFW